MDDAPPHAPTDRRPSMYRCIRAEEGRRRSGKGAERGQGVPRSVCVGVEQDKKRVRKENKQKNTHTKTKTHNRRRPHKWRQRVRSEVQQQLMISTWLHNRAALGCLRLWCCFELGMCGCKLLKVHILIRLLQYTHHFVLQHTAVFRTAQRESKAKRGSDL